MRIVREVRSLRMKNSCSILLIFIDTDPLCTDVQIFVALPFFFIPFVAGEVSAVGVFGIPE